MHSAPSPAAIRKFRQLVYKHVTSQPRQPMPWRYATNPYHIHVSEIMLQQTQVERVKEKYPLFLGLFPDYQTLAAAPRSELLATWQGLGYNRRAVALQEAARNIVNEYGGLLPREPEQLQKLPGIGSYTAAAIAAFAYNQAVPMIETNIRTVYIHCFFPEHSPVHDRDLLPLIAATVDRKNPREWYYALMDYGVMLKQKYGNPSRRSAHHSRQSPFKGSHRQLRGALLKVLLTQSPCSVGKLSEKLEATGERLHKALNQLVEEGFIAVVDDQYTICT